MKFIRVPFAVLFLVAEAIIAVGPTQLALAQEALETDDYSTVQTTPTQQSTSVPAQQGPVALSDAEAAAKAQKAYGALGKDREAAAAAKERAAAKGKDKDADEDDPIKDSKCADASFAAKATCATGTALGMDPQSAMMVEMMTQQAMTLSASMKASTGVADICKNQMDLQGLMGKIALLKTAGCGAAMETCDSMCTDDMAASEARINSLEKEYHLCLTTKERMDALAKTPGGAAAATTTTCSGNETSPNPIPFAAFLEKSTEELQLERSKLPRYKKRIALCESYKNNALMMAMQSMSSLQGAAQAKACVNAASGSNPFNGLPSAQKTDCTNPEVAKVSPQCICQADPKNPICPGAAGAGGATGGMAGPTSGKADLGSGLYANDGDVDPGARTDEKSGAVQASKGSNTIEGGGAGGPGGGFGGGGGGGDEGGGAPGKGSDKSVISGLAGGGAGGGSGGLAKTSSSGGGGISGAMRGLMDKFNLKSFLPNRKDYKNRGIAGMSIPSSDGITGPMGPSLFEKVSTQYKKQQTNLIQDK